MEEEFVEEFDTSSSSSGDEGDTPTDPVCPAFDPLPYFTWPSAYQQPPPQLPTTIAPVRKKRKRRKRKAIKLSDFPDSLRRTAWETYERKIEAREEITQSPFQQPINTEACSNRDSTSTSTSTFTEHDSLIAKLVRQIGTQRRKRAREKLHRKRQAQNKGKNAELNLNAKKTDEDQPKTGQKITKNSKDSKEILERLRLLDAMDKLRHVRAKRLENTRGIEDMDEGAGQRLELRQLLQAALNETQKSK